MSEPPAANTGIRPSRRWFGRGLLAALILVLIACSIAWNNGLRDQIIPRNFGVVEAGRLFRSGQISARLIESTLQGNGIKTIVVLSDSGMKPADLEAEQQAAAKLGIDRNVFPLSGDGTGKLEEYAD